MTPLTAGASFVGRPQTVDNYDQISVNVHTDTSSTLYIEQSLDGSFWDFTESAAVTPNEPFVLTTDVVASEARTRLVNDGATQTFLRLQTLYLDDYHAYTVSGASSVVLVDPNDSYTPWGTGNPVPVELAGDSYVKPIGSNSSINASTFVFGLSTYTSSSELSYEPDVAMFFKSDAEGILKFQFSPDDLDWSTFPVNGFAITAGVWEFHTAVKLPRYFRWEFENTSFGLANFEAYVYYGTFRQGNLPLNQSIGADNDAIVTRSVLAGQVRSGTYANVGITSTKSGDQAIKVGLHEPLTAFGDVRVSQSVPEVQLSWVYGGINPLLINEDVSGGSLSAANSLLTVGSGTGTSDYGKMESRRYLKYRTGQGALFRGTCIFDTPAAGNTQLFGVGTAENGLFFGYHDLSFGVLRRDNGVDNWTYQADWNDDNFDGTGDSGETLNPQLGNVYEINYQWLGFGAIFFSIETTHHEIRHAHAIEYANTTTTPTIQQPSLPIIIESRNAGNNTNVQIKSSSVAAFNQGPVADLGSTYSEEATALTGVTSEVAVLSLKVNETMNGVQSYIPVLPLEFTGVGEGTGSNPIRFGLYLDTSLGGAPSWTNVDASFSTVSYDTAATTVTGGTKLGSYIVERNRGLQINLKEKNIQLGRNQLLTVTASSASTCDPDVALVWLEQDSG